MLISLATSLDLQLGGENGKHGASRPKRKQGGKGLTRTHGDRSQEIPQATGIGDGQETEEIGRTDLWAS